MLQRTLFSSAMLSMMANGILLEDLFANNFIQINSFRFDFQTNSQISSQIGAKNGTIFLPIKNSRLT